MLTRGKRPKTSSDMMQQAKSVENIWTTSSDNAFAQKLLQEVDWSVLRPTQQTAKLCKECKTIDFDKFTELHLERQSLLRRSADCDFCGFCYECLDIAADQNDPVHMIRDGITLRLGKTGPPVISVYVDPGTISCLSLPFGGMNTNMVSYRLCCGLFFGCSS